jgi:putative acetyltransferase
MTTSWAIRLTRPAHRDAIVGVVRNAFSDPSRDGQEEVDIVLNTWSLNAAVYGLDLVAIEDGQVVGHVLGAYGSLDERRVVGVAPLAVAPHRQSEGIGSGLVNELLRQAEGIGEPLLLLLGLPSYYGRFGFEAGGPLGIDCPSVGLGNPHFLIRKLATYSADYRGEFRYCWELASG